MDLTALVQAFATRNWYAVAAVLVFLLMNVIKAIPVGSTVYAWLNDRKAAWVLPIALGFGSGFYDAFQAGSGWAMAIVAGMTAIMAVGVPAMGVHSALKDSALPYGNKKAE